MLAKLAAVAAGIGAPTLPFTLGDVHPGGGWAGWAHHAGTAREGGAPVSVWRIASPRRDDPRLEAARHGVRKLKTVRHPNILQFRDSAEVEERGETVIYLVTEEVTPLLPTLAGLGMDPAAAAEFAAGGVHAIAKAVAFLAHDAGGLASGGLAGASAVGLTPSLEWRLVGLDFLDAVAGAAAPGGCALARAPAYLPRPYLAPELARGEWDAVAAGPAWAPDAWGLGCLLAEAFTGAALDPVDGLRAAAAALPPPVAKAYQRLLATAPARRLDPRALVGSAALHTPAVRALEALDGLALADPAAKAAFFSATLPAALPRFPPALAQRRLLPALGTALEYGGAPPSALAPLLTVAAGLDEDGWARTAVPLLARLARSPDRGLRAALLEAVPRFGPRLPPALVESDFYPAFASGFTDATPHLRDATLKAMATLGPALSPRTLSGPLLKALARLQVDDAPGIRANTTLLLGALAPRLEPAARARVLMNALARALRDPWPPARAAGARALSATLDLHSPADLAARALPAVGPGAVDADGPARAAALEAAAAVLARLQAHAKEMDAADAAAAAAGAAGAAGAPASAGGGGGGGRRTGFGSSGGADAPAATSSSWGLSAISSLAGAALGAAAGAAGGGSASGGGGTRPAPANGCGPAPAAARPPPPPPRPRPTAAFAASDDDDEEDGLEDGAEAAARARLSGLGLGAVRRAAAAAPPTAAFPATAAADGGDDDDDDGWEDMDVPAPPPPPKPAAAAPRSGGLGARPAVPGLSAGRGGRGGRGGGSLAAGPGLRLGAGRGGLAGRGGAGSAPAFEL